MSDQIRQPEEAEGRTVAAGPADAGAGASDASGAGLAAGRKRWWRRTLAVVLVLPLTASALAWATWQWHPHAPALYLVDEPPAADEITLEQIDEIHGGDVFWIDARTREHFDRGHVPGALSLDNRQRETRLFEEFEIIQDIDRQIVIYCESTGCQSGRELAQYLRQRLPWDPLVLRGGWPTYRDSGRPVAVGDEG